MDRCKENNINNFVRGHFNMFNIMYFKNVVLKRRTRYIGTKLSVGTQMFSFSNLLMIIDVNLIFFSKIIC